MLLKLFSHIHLYDGKNLRFCYLNADLGILITYPQSATALIFVSHSSAIYFKMQKPRHGLLILLRNGANL